MTTTVNGLAVHRFVAVVQVDVAIGPNETTADAERYARTALSEAMANILTDPGDDVTVVSIMEVAQ